MATTARRLLFITQKIREDDDDLAFVILWVREFIKQGFAVEVICLEKGRFDGSFPVHSLGKELGYGKARRTLRFLKFIFSLNYDRVFVHMNPEYFTLGGWWWKLRGVPMYLWYTHYSWNVHVFLAGVFCKRMFAATPQSLPQFNGSPKKVVLGHGIDVDFWLAGADMSAEKKSEAELLTVHRICRSKRAEIGIKALLSLPQEYTLTIYGRDVEKDYASELRELVAREHLQSRVTFAGPVPMYELKKIYPQYRIVVNMASETIDKTMVEAMLFGIYPVTTKGNSIAIGLPVYPENDEPETIARFIKDRAWAQYDAAFLQNIVRSRHSLPSLVSAMSAYIAPGT
jgi:glycosyltransferase involved in cell wall biosynthesis